MKSVSEHFANLIQNGAWNGPNDFFKKNNYITNCNKCYGRRHRGRDVVKNEYIPCNCIKNKLNDMVELERKHSITAIGTDNLKGI